MFCKYALVPGLQASTIHRFLHLGEHFVRGSQREIELTVPVNLAGRKYLASSNTLGFPKLLSGPTEDYPLLLKAQNREGATIAQWAKRSKEIIEEALKGFQKGGPAVAILFRDLPIRNAKDFSQWLNNLEYEYGSYKKSTGLLPEIAENVAAGSEESKESTIEPHNEQAYSTFYPTVFTMCTFEKAPHGGETAIADAREVLRKLDPNFVDKCERKLLRYWQYLPDKMSKHSSNVYKTWQHQFGIHDQMEVTEYLTDQGYNFEWEKNNLFLWKILPPTNVHPRTGDRIWFNQMAANHCSYHQATPLFEGIHLPNKEYPYHTTYGDGEEIGQNRIDEVRQAKWESAVGFDWNEGDVLFLDNMIMQHSRLSFVGNRQVGISYLNY